MQVASMIADIPRTAAVVPGTGLNGMDDMTGDLSEEPASVLYVSGEESVQQVILKNISPDQGKQNENPEHLVKWRQKRLKQ